jgi:hypothetical protein
MEVIVFLLFFGDRSLAHRDRYAPQYRLLIGAICNQNQI